ncbi:MAG: Spy/CpxP family protein refolding chaperone [Nitrospirae bacterium]|nr:Spy/CpxP family protein refolding chaperone [Nitrospirota bacterium]
MKKSKTIIKRLIKRLIVVLAALLLALGLNGYVMAGGTTGIMKTGALGNGVESTLATYLINLNLTEAQKQQIAAILKSNGDALKLDVAKVIADRKNLLEAIHGQTYNELAVRQAAHQTAVDEEDLDVLRARVYSSIQYVLTPDQKSTLNELMAEAATKIQNRLQQITNLVDLWISQHS